MASCCRLPLHPFLSHKPTRLAFSRNIQVIASTAESLYPPILPSRTAKSKSAKGRVVSELFEQLRACTAQEKIRALTRIQRKKYVIYPQTFALNADRWYQHYTKTAYVSGLPEKTVDIDECVLSELRSAVCNSILQEHWYMKKGKAFIYREQEHLAAPNLRNIVCALKNVLAKENPLLGLSSLGKHAVDMFLKVCLGSGFMYVQNDLGVMFLFVDFDPQVNFYWLRGERTIPRGHRSGRVEPMRFQIDDKPHSQIRIPQQLPEVWCHTVCYCQCHLLLSFHMWCVSNDVISCSLFLLRWTSRLKFPWFIQLQTCSHCSGGSMTTTSSQVCLIPKGFTLNSDWLTIPRSAHVWPFILFFRQVPNWKIPAATVTHSFTWCPIGFVGTKWARGVFLTRSRCRWELTVSPACSRGLGRRLCIKVTFNDFDSIQKGSNQTEMNSL